MQRQLRRQPVLTINRVGRSDTRLVYFLYVDCLLHYPIRPSRIVYIGATTTGVERIAKSAAYRAGDVFHRFGAERIDASALVIKPLRRARDWERILERALILEFRDAFGSAPTCNVQGRMTVRREEHLYYQPRDLRRQLMLYAG